MHHHHHHHKLLAESDTLKTVYQKTNNCSPAAVKKFMPGNSNKKATGTNDPVANNKEWSEVKPLE